MSKVQETPTRKGTQLNPVTMQPPAKLVIKDVEPNSPLAKKIVDHYGGRLKQFHVKQQQNYSLSEVKRHRAHIDWGGARATYVNDGGQEYLTLEVDHEVRAEVVEQILGSWDFAIVDVVVPDAVAGVALAMFVRGVADVTGTLPQRGISWVHDEDSPDAEKQIVTSANAAFVPALAGDVTSTNYIGSFKVDLRQLKPGATTIELWGYISTSNETTEVGGTGVRDDGAVGRVIDSVYRGAVTKDWRDIIDGVTTPVTQLALSSAVDTLFMDSTDPDHYATILTSFPGLAALPHVALGYAGTPAYGLTWVTRPATSVWDPDGATRSPSGNPAAFVLWPPRVAPTPPGSQFPVDWVGGEAPSALTYYPGTTYVQTATVHYTSIQRYYNPFAGPEAWTLLRGVPSPAADTSVIVTNVHRTKYYVPVYRFETPNPRAAAINFAFFKGSFPFDTSSSHIPPSGESAPTFYQYETVAKYPGRIQLGTVPFAVPVPSYSLGDVDASLVNHFGLTMLCTLTLDPTRGALSVKLA